MQKDEIESMTMSPFPIKAVKNELFYINLNFEAESFIPFVLKAKDQIKGMNLQIHTL